MGTEFKYGLSLEDVNTVRRPARSQLSWGEVTVCADRPEYVLFRLDLPKGAAQPLHFHRCQWVAYLVEEGQVLLRQKDQRGATLCSSMKPSDVFRAHEGSVHSFCGLERSVVYGFSGPGALGDVRLVETPEEAVQNCVSIAGAGNLGKVASRTFDFRDKYWGSIESVISDNVAGKHIVLRAGSQSSLEYHCHKVESYYIHSGKTKLGLRVGRGTNKSLVLTRGDAYDMEPGLMHMRIGVEDCVIIEVSSRDDDRDSHLVEDGRTYEHKET